MTDLIEDGPGDWHGTARRPQGTCLPPTQPPDATPRFAVRTGVPCLVRSVTEAKWRPYRTTKESGFERYERVDGQGYQFRLAGYLILVSARYVTVRPKT